MPSDAAMFSSHVVLYIRSVHVYAAVRSNVLTRYNSKHAKGAETMPEAVFHIFHNMHYMDDMILTQLQCLNLTLFFIIDLIQELNV